MTDCPVLRHRFVLLCLLLVGSSPLFVSGAEPDFELKDGDRVVTLGGAFVHTGRVEFKES